MLMTAIKHHHAQSYITPLWVTIIHTEFITVNMTRPSVCETTLGSRCDTTSQCLWVQERFRGWLLSFYPQSTSTSGTLPQISVLHTNARILYKHSGWQFPRKWEGPLLQWVDLNKRWWRLAPHTNKLLNNVLLFMCGSNQMQIFLSAVWRQSGLQNLKVHKSKPNHIHFLICRFK